MLPETVKPNSGEHSGLQKEIDCGWREDPKHLLKCLVEGNMKEARHLIETEDLNEAMFNFVITDFTGIARERYNWILQVEARCRLTLFGMAMVFGDEEVIRAVLDNGASMTARCRVACCNIADMNDYDDEDEDEDLANEANNMLNSFVEAPAVYLVSKASLFHEPTRYKYLELLRKEYGLDLTERHEIVQKLYTTLIDLAEPDPWADTDEPPIVRRVRDESLLQVIAHELPLETLDKYCKLFPETLHHDGIFHLGKCLKIGDIERLRVLVSNGLHHRPELSKKILKEQGYESGLYTEDRKYVFRFEDINDLTGPQDYRVEGYGYVLKHVRPYVPEVGRDKYLCWLAMFQLAAGFEFQMRDAPFRQGGQYWMSARDRALDDYVRRLQACFEQWSSAPKRLAFLARNVIRNSIAIEGFQESVKRLVESKLLRDYIFFNGIHVNDYFDTVTWPTGSMI